MKKLLFLPILLLACTEHKNRTLMKIEDEVDKFYRQAASKKNTTWKVLELKAIDFARKGEGTLDSLHRIQYQNLRAHYIAEADRYSKLAEEEVTKFRNLPSTGHDHVATATKGHQIILRMEALMDSARLFDQADSLLGLRIKSRGIDHHDYYYTKVFLSGTAGEKNISDTLLFMLDKNLKVIWPSENHVP